jgi:glutamate synthase (NADPH/NADH) small chain
LALFGYDVVMYERNSVPGGLGVSGIAPYKIHAADALDEVDYILSLGVELKTNTAVGVDVSADELLERHDAVFCGVGLGADRPLPIGCGELDGVTGAVDWIAAMKLGTIDMTQFRRVAVIGGGNTALDAARELAQLGSDSVHLVYRRSEAEMSGYEHEWAQAKQEGVSLVSNAVVKSIESVSGGLELELAKARSGRATDDRLPALLVDHVLVAIGQAGADSITEIFKGIQCDDRGRILVLDDEGSTHQLGVFAGGDAVNGGKEVVNAVDEGQRAAGGIIKFLMGVNHG